MKYGESSPEGNPLSSLADKRAEEYFAKTKAAIQAKVEASMLKLRKELGLKPNETLDDYLGLSPSKSFVPSDAPIELDPEVGKAIDEFFDKCARVLAGDAKWEDEFGKPGDGS